jgi:uncharacterized protein YndB with AHSA1/START domain
MLIELALPVPVEEAWAHLREPALIRRWFGWEYDGLAREIEVIFVEEVVADDAAHTLAWETGDRFALVPDGSHARLRVHHAPPPDVYDDIGEGWITFVEQLRFALTRHRGEERATHYLSSDVPLALLPALEAMGGEVWFRSEHQLGLVVAGLGDGLLVAVEKPGVAAFLTLSGYGEAARTLPLHTARWDAWWAELASE